jgi:hypothetical protein
MTAVLVQVWQCEQKHSSFGYVSKETVSVVEQQVTKNKTQVCTMEL